MMKKMKRIYVIILGTIIGVAIAVLAVMFLFKPQSQAIAAKEKEYTEKKGIADTVPQKTQELANVTATVQQQEKLLKKYSSRFRSIHFEKASGDWDALFDLWNEYREQLGPRFVKFVESTGCRLTSGFAMPTPPIKPISPPPTGFLAVPETGAMNVTVAGTLRQIMTLLERLHEFEYLNTVGPVSIQGTSPMLNASFPITFYIVVETSEKAKPSAAAPAAAPGGGPPGAPGAPGGGPPGAPGGPGAPGFPGGGPPAQGGPPPAPGKGSAARAGVRGGEESAEESPGGLGRRRRESLEGSDMSLPGGKLGSRRDILRESGMSRP